MFINNLFCYIVSFALFYQKKSYNPCLNYWKQKENSINGMDAIIRIIRMIEFITYLQKMYHRIVAFGVFSLFSNKSLFLFDII